MPRLRRVILFAAVVAISMASSPAFSQSSSGSPSGIAGMQTVFAGKSQLRADTADLQSKFDEYMRTALSGKLRDLRSSNLEVKNFLTEVGNSVLWTGVVTPVISVKGDAVGTTEQAQLGPVRVIRDGDIDLGAVDTAAEIIAGVVRRSQRPEWNGTVHVGCEDQALAGEADPEFEFAIGQLADNVATQLQATVSATMTILEWKCDDTIADGDMLLNFGARLSEGKVMLDPVVSFLNQKIRLVTLNFALEDLISLTEELAPFHVALLTAIRSAGSGTTMSAPPAEFANLPEVGTGPRRQFALGKAFAHAGYPKLGAYYLDAPDLEAGLPEEAASLAYEQGMLSFARSDFKRAADRLESALTLAPERGVSDPSLYEIVADAAFAIGDLDRAIKFGRMAERGGGASFAARVQLVNAILLDGWTRRNEADAKERTPASFAQALELLRTVSESPGEVRDNETIDNTALRIAYLAVNAVGVTSEPSRADSYKRLLVTARDALKLTSDDRRLDREVYLGRAGVREATLQADGGGDDLLHEALQHFDAAEAIRNATVFGGASGGAAAEAMCDTEATSDEAAPLLRYPLIGFERAEALAMLRQFERAHRSAQEAREFFDCHIVRTQYEARNLDVLVALFAAFDQANRPGTAEVTAAFEKALADTDGAPSVNLKRGQVAVDWSFDALVPYICLRYPEPMREKAIAVYDLLYRKLGLQDETVDLCREWPS